MKSPAFQFYPKDWLSDANVTRMSLEAKGVYIQLICHCWLEGSISADVGEWAKLCGCNADALRTVYDDVVRCFDPSRKDEGKLLHPRLEIERANQRARRKSARKAALQRWDGHDKRNASALRTQSPSSASASSTASASKKSNRGFTQFWEAYPRRAGSNPKKAARTAWDARVAEESVDILQHGAERYKAYCDATGKTGTEYVKQAVSWLSPRFEGWAQDWGVPDEKQPGWVEAEMAKVSFGE